MNIPELVFTDDRGNHLVIMSEVVKKLYTYRQFHENSTEAGGVLIGERRGDHIVITEISEPGPRDMRSRHQFTRQGEHHQHKVNESFLTSNGYHVYLGEWHTHPEDYPRPSNLDLHSWRTKLQASEPMVMLIVGRSDVWVGKKHGINIKKLSFKPLKT
ncbi:TPA: peptidase [Serratia marcescens]|nr:peptidase [Serratia marcescens]HAT4512917.1 peptidase [Serratia marcescens]HAT4536470.1 peptidase [Serratia marcescens]